MACYHLPGVQCDECRTALRTMVDVPADGLTVVYEENRMLLDELAVLRARLRTTAQILIEEIGADGPMNAELAAHNAAQLIKNLRVDAARATAHDKILLAVAGLFNGWANSSAYDDYEGYSIAADALLAIGDALGKPWVDHVRCKLCGGDGMTVQDDSVVCPACNGTGMQEDTNEGEHDGQD